MKVKTSELTGAALDWAVCDAAGLIAAYPKHRNPVFFLNARKGKLHGPLYPSTDWSQGGPIIEREKIELGLREPALGGWFSCMNNDIHSIGMLHYGTGPTPLIAAMRCFVASVKGEYVDIPEELMA